MNHFEIEEVLDRQLMSAEILLEKRMRAAQIIILDQLAGMYRKYEREGDLTYQEMQKYNRLEKELQAIAAVLTAEYAQTVVAVQELQENQYLLKFLLTAYLFDQFVARPKLPVKEVIAAALIFIITSFKLPRLSAGQEADVIVRIEKVLDKGVENRETSEEIGKRIERALPKDLAETKGLVKDLTKSLIDRLEPTINDAGFQIPSAADVKREIKFDGLKLSHFLTVKRNRTVLEIRKQINAALRKNETVGEMSKRVSKVFEKETNSLRLFMRNASDRVRAVALGNVENQIANISDVRGVWLSKRDNIVRFAHKKLDGDRTDRKGYFHYQGMKAMAPRMWGVPSMDNYCRCKKLTLLDFKVPVVAEGVEYNNKEYSRQLTELAKKKVEEKGITYEKAFTEALKEVPEPQGGMPFVSYEEWLRIMGVKGSLDGIF